MIERELWIRAVLFGACDVLMVVYMAYTWGDLRYQIRNPHGSTRYKRRLVQAEANLWAAGCILWLVFVGTIGSIIALLRATGELQQEEWAKIVVWAFIVMLLGVPAWVIVKLYTRRRLDELE